MDTVQQFSSEKISNNKFMFVEEEVPPNLRAKLKQKIKNDMKGKLNLIINKQNKIQVPDFESGIVPSSIPNSVSPSLRMLGRQLDIEFNSFDQQLIFPSTKKFYENYSIDTYLGEGCLGLVKKVIRKSDGKKYAVKIVKTTDEEILRNVKTLRVNYYQDGYRVSQFGETGPLEHCEGV